MSATKALTGTLEERPLAMLLAVVAERAMTGTFTFGRGDARATMAVKEGMITRVDLPPGSGVAYLGTILYETGVIDTDVLDATLLEVATTRRLHGDILVVRGHITPAQRDEALVEQTCRRVHQLFSLGPDTSWRFEADTSAAEVARDASRPSIDPWQAMWRGLRERPVCPHVRRTLAKLDGAMQLRDAQLLGRYGFAAEELAFASSLVNRAMTAVEAFQASGLSGERTQLVLYALVLGRMLGKPRVIAPVPSDLDVHGIRARAESIDHEDPYTVLGIPRGASGEATRAAYLRLSRAWNPDRLPPELATVRAECEHIFARLENAHRVLTEQRERHTPVVSPMSMRMQMPDEEGEDRQTLRDVDRALGQSRFDEALVIAKSLALAGKDGPAARAAMAWCETKAGMAPREVLDRAMAAFDRILAGDPDCIRALYYRAMIGRRLGRDIAAMKDLRKVARLDPSHLEAVREVRLHEMRSREVPKLRNQDDDDDAPVSSSGSGLRGLIARVARR